MDEKILEQLSSFNQLYKKLDVTYHMYAKKLGISDSALWILYSVCENNGTMTQNQLSKEWYFAPQTINSALKGLEKKEIIRFESMPGNKKNKFIILTDYGVDLANRTVHPLMKAEEQAFAELDDTKRSEFLSAMNEYTSYLQSNLKLK